MSNIFEKICSTLILLKIFDIYFCHYFASNMKIAIIPLWYAMEPQIMYHLIAKDKVAEQYIVGNTPIAIVLELQWIYSIVRISK